MTDTHELIQDNGSNIVGDDALNEIDALLDPPEPDAPEPDAPPSSPLDSDDLPEPDPLDDDAPQPDIDYDLKMEVPMPYGMESMTLGKMKDEISTMHQRESSVIEKENVLLRDRNEFESLVQEIGPLPPQVIEQLQQKRQASLVRENQLMLEAIPEWKDTKIFTQDRSRMLETASQYGYNEADLDAIGDHRLVKLVRDYAALKVRLEKADPKQLPKKQTRSGRTKPAPLKQDFIDNAARSTDQQVKYDAIAKLIG